MAAAKRFLNPDAEVRHSQLITTYGPGAMVDLPNASIVIGGLNYWSYGTAEPEVITEPRLINKLRQVLNVGSLRLQKPPLHDIGPGNRSLSGGIRSPEFPGWFVVQLQSTHQENGREYRTRPLVEAHRLEKRQYRDANRKAHDVVPVRFVQSCPNGHLSDVNWRRFVHRDRSACDEVLWLDEAGSGNDFTEIYIRCPKCKERRPLSETTQTPGQGDDRGSVLGACRGERPWLGPNNLEDCINSNGKRYANRLLVRSASNAYFPETISTISIPEPNDEIRSLLANNLRLLEKIDSAGTLSFWLKQFAPADFAQKLDGQDPQVIFELLESVRGGEVPTQKIPALKAEELRLLLGPSADLQKGHDASRFYAEELDLSDKPLWFSDRISRVLKVHCLREVMALIGFTRLEPVVSQIDGDPLDLGVKRAAIDVKEATWLPAVENLGEGIFLGFSTPKVHNWLKHDAVKQHLSKHQEAFAIWNKEHGLTEDKFRWPGGAYVMLHSLAHLLITEAALDCGYSASAIKERIYAFPDLGYGILLYTGGSGSEGTLGGLVSLANRLDELLMLALERGGLCSNDPFCSSHQPNDSLEKRYAHGAACHSCLLIAETSCERHNEFLDRALVVPTLDQQEVAFFTNDGLPRD